MKTNCVHDVPPQHRHTCQARTNRTKNQHGQRELAVGTAQGVSLREGASDGNEEHNEPHRDRIETVQLVRLQRPKEVDEHGVDREHSAHMRTISNEEEHEPRSRSAGAALAIALLR